MGNLTDRATQALRFDEIDGRFDAWLLCIAAALAVTAVVVTPTASAAPSRASRYSLPQWLLLAEIHSRPCASKARP